MLLSADALFTGDAVLAPGWVRVSPPGVPASSATASPTGGAALESATLGPPEGTVLEIGAGAPPENPDEHAAWIAPGLVDVHCHGGGGASFDQASAAAVTTALAAHRSRGTTTTVASLVTAAIPDLVDQVAALAGWVERGELAGIHLEGPWLAPARKGAHDPALLAAPEPSVVATVLDAARGTVRMVTLAPELPHAEAACALFVDRGVVVAVGHTDADFATTRQALEWGATGATHLFNAMPPLHHRDPGPILALLRDERAWLEIIADGTHLAPELAAWVVDTLPGRAVLITDAMAAAGVGDGSYVLGGLEVTVADGVARLVRDGAIAGSTLFLAEAVERCHAFGVQAEEALAAATSVPADYLGLDAGRLVAGGAADLVLLDDRLALQRTLRHGVWMASPGSPALR